MSMIDIYFGEPTSEKVIGQNEEWAFNRDTSIETANLGTFNAVMKVLVKKNEKDENYFDLLIFSITGQELICPVITFSSYIFNGTKYPKLTIRGDYLISRNNNLQVFIADEWIEKIGRFVEEDFDYEFIEYKRIGKVKLKNGEITYLINNEPYIHHNGKFIKIKKC